VSRPAAPALAISGRTRVAGIIGSPVAHSLSPAMHNAAFAARGLDWRYVAFDVPVDQFDAYVQKLKDKGVAVSPVLNHDDSESTVAREMHDGVFVRSVYFRDPDGVLLEFACWTKTFGPEDVSHAPANAKGERVQLVS